MATNTRLLARAAVVGVVFAGLLAASPAPAQAVSKPPKGAMFYDLSAVTCRTKNGYVSVGGVAKSTMHKMPKQKGVAVGAYQMVTLELQTQAGYGGSLWTKAARTRKFSDTVNYDGGQLPQTQSIAVWENYESGGLQYRLKLTVNAVRNVVLGFDTRAWKYTVYSPVRTCQDDSGIITGGT